MSIPNLSDEQQKIVDCLYNAWQTRPDGIGLGEHELAEQTKLDMNDLVKEVQLLKARGIIATG